MEQDNDDIDDYEPTDEDLEDGIETEELSHREDDLEVIDTEETIDYTDDGHAIVDAMGNTLVRI